jgi:hypothetical protein
VAYARRVRTRTTAEAAWQWIDAHVAQGRGIVVERDVIHVPAHRFPTIRVDDIGEHPGQYGAAGASLLIVGAPDHLGPDARTRRDAFLGQATEVARFEPDAARRGPAVVVYELK